MTPNKQIYKTENIFGSSLQETCKKNNNKKTLWKFFRPINRNIYIDLFPFFMTVGTLDNAYVQQIFKICNMK